MNDLNILAPTAVLIFVIYIIVTDKTMSTTHAARRNCRISALISGLAFILSCTPQAQPDPEPSPVPEPEPEPVVNVEATVYTTLANQNQLLEESKVRLEAPGMETGHRITIDKNTRYQEIVGFGPALTGASCYNILKMSPEDRAALLEELFDTEKGLGISMVRVSIGSSDFSVNKDFTWCDEKGIENFSVPVEDALYLIPILKEVYKINPNLQILASPWTCPLWMKRMSVNDDSDFVYSGDPNVSSWAGGSLKPSCYDDYAKYFVLWIQAMQKEGFNIYGITVQNEPLNAGNTASVYMTWQEQRDFIKQSLGPAFAEAGLATKIICYDHNYNGYNYPINIFNDKEAAKYVAGSAWHDYNGTLADMDNIVTAAPDKEIYFTEASIGRWNYSFAGKLISDMSNIFMGTMERGCKGVTLWNLALDENNGPYRHHGCYTCYGAITISSTTHKVVERLSHYYDIAHCTKVVKNGAVRIGTRGNDITNLSCQAFMNPDGSYGVLLLNKSIKGESQTVVLDNGVHSIKCEVPLRSVVSVIWKD